MPNLFTFSNAGGHAANEDAFLTSVHPDDESLLICVLADGQGGRPGGAEAAEQACAVAVEAALSYSPKQLTRTKSWLRILSEADSAVKQDPVAGFTTLVALCVTGDIVCGCSSGDSAAVLLNVYDRYHELTSEQIKNPPVGSGLAQGTPFCETLIEPWQVVVMSDGLWKYVGWHSVATMIKRSQGEELRDALANAAKSAGGGSLRDDTTLIVVTSEPILIDPE